MLRRPMSVPSLPPFLMLSLRWPIRGMVRSLRRRRRDFEGRGRAWADIERCEKICPEGVSWRHVPPAMMNFHLPK